MNLKTGDILHCRSNRLLARIIMKLTNGRFSHSAVIVECWGQLYVVDAQFNGVNPRPFEEWKKKYNYDFVVHRRKDLQKKPFSIKAFSKVGITNYDMQSLIVDQPMYILFGKWRGKTHKEALSRMYCSEFVGWLHGFNNWWSLSPQELYQKCCESDEFKELENVTF